jgi:hypothetical protein
VIDDVKQTPTQRYSDARWLYRLAATLIVGLVLPLAIVIFALLGLATWDAIMGR